MYDRNTEILAHLSAIDSDCEDGEAFKIALDALTVFYGGDRLKVAIALAKSPGPNWDEHPERHLRSAKQAARHDGEDLGYHLRRLVVALVEGEDMP